MSTTQQRKPLRGCRTALVYFFIVAPILYIIYSSQLFVNNNTINENIEDNIGNNHINIDNKDTTNNINNNNNLDSTSTNTNIVNKISASSSDGNSSHPCITLEEERVVDDALDMSTTMLPQTSQSYDTELKHIVFGIAASANLWKRRKEYVKLWWRPRETRGIVWMDRHVRNGRNEPLPEIRVSADTSRFKYSNRQGHRSALRISRIVSETLKLGLKDVRWFVMGDDDTVFFVDNVVRILSKYDYRQFYYVGSSSESHLQNIHFSYAMAYGGGGFAISYPLAKELAKMQDGCIQRYPGLYGSDDRIQACMAELGVPLSKEAGFHQYDVYGDLLGLLGAHPVTPLASIHHLDVVEPVFPGMSRVKALQHLFVSVRHDSASIMQQSICYDRKRSWSISVSWGFVVQIWKGVISPRELMMPTRTFLNWYKKADYTAYAFNTRPVPKHPCFKPVIFYMNNTKNDRTKKQTVGIYYPHKTHSRHCRSKMGSPERISSIVVFKSPDSLRWQKSPRRDCCRVMPSNKWTSLFITVGNCREGEISELH